MDGPPLTRDDFHAELVAATIDYLRSKYGPPPGVVLSAIGTTVAAVTPVILERVAQRIEATAEEAATRSRDSGRGYTAAAALVRELGR